MRNVYSVVTCDFLVFVSWRFEFAVDETVLDDVILALTVVEPLSLHFRNWPPKCSSIFQCGFGLFTGTRGNK